MRKKDIKQILALNKEYRYLGPGEKWFAFHGVDLRDVRLEHEGTK
jgi:hypothetical protein